MVSEERVRVLLVDDDPDYPVLMRDFLGDVDDRKYKIDWAASYKSAAEHIRRGTHDVYLVDYRLGEFTGLDLLRNELDYGRRGPVVILTAQATRELDIEAMKAGAVDFLIKGQFRAPDLERCIRYAIARHRESPPQPAAARSSRRMLSFIGAKGGVGTTTVALNVALCLARQGHRTLAVDLRPHYGTLANSLGTVVRHDLGDLLHRRTERVDEAALRKCLIGHVSGLEVLASPQLAHKFRPITDEAARAIVDTAYQMSSFSVIDLPCDASTSNREALWRSTFVGLVVERDPAALASAERTLELLGSWGIRKAVGLVIVDRTPPLGEPVSEIAHKLGRDVFGVIPPAADALREAAVRRSALVLSAPQAEASRAYSELATRLSADALRPLLL